MAELLVELFSEEIPARMQARAAEDLKRLASDALNAAALPFADARAFVTPRRLALAVEGLPVAQADVKDERRGPRVDAPPAAIDGFLRANGITLEQAEKRDTGKGTFYFAVVEKKGRRTAEVLAELLPSVFGALPWPKSMRWGAGDIRWVRPLHGILCAFDGQVVKLKFAGIQSGDTTQGHRFLAPEFFAARSFAEYRDSLRSAYVMLDATERRDSIARDAALLAKDEGLTLKRDEGLLDEVAGLIEWPVPLLGSIDQQFMDVPPEVLTTAMRAHQKYFALEKPDGTLAPRFIVIANMLTEDGGKQVVAGNERVLRARLSDARFFWDQDRKQTLESRVPALKEIVFHAKLGTVAEKVSRVEALAAELCQYIPGAEPAAVQRAAHLAKADLVTGMVGEFPELQGVMGRYYALHDGETRPVADAIAEHYSPKGPDDKCPSAPVSIAIALADKLDTLAGFFHIKELPTGSKDPFALRRAALGVIRLILENNLRVSLDAAFLAAIRPVVQQIQKRQSDEHLKAQENLGLASRVVKASVPAELTPDGWQGAYREDRAKLLSFFEDRLKVALREKGVRHDLIDAVFALGGEDDLVRLLARVDALAGFLASEDGRNLLTAYRRASNIVTIEEKKDKAAYDGAVDPGLLSQPEEQRLAKVLAEAQAGTKPALDKEDFTGAMTVLAALRGPVDAFFDKVTVNTDDKAVRANRLRLLSQIRATLGAVADFSRIVEG